MEHRKAPTSSITMIDASNNNNLHHHNRRKKRTAKRQQLPSSLTSKNHHVPSVVITDSNSNSQKIYLYGQQQQEQEHIPMKNPLAWTKKWTKWFSSCGSEGIPHTAINSITVKRARTKSENDASKRNSVDQDEKKKLSTTSSNFAISQNSNENQEGRLSRTSSQQQHHHHHHQSNDKVNNSSTVVYRDNSRRYSNSFFTSARYGGPRTSIAAIPLTTTTAITTTNTSQQKQPSHLSRSVDRLHNKSNRRELRYEEHDDYIPSPLYSIQCHPTIDHYAKNLNQSTHYSSNHRHSQIPSTNNRSLLPRPYSSNIPLSHSIQIMSKTSSDNNNNNNNTYGKLSECHSPLTPLENSSVKPPRRIESAYSQFPIQQEPVYANTQSLYDNIVYPQSTSTLSNRMNEQDKRSCASQTQLTWTMATFSSFVDLENQSVIIPQPDPNTLYSVVQHHHHSQPPPSASTETIEQMKRISPRLQYTDDTDPSSHYQRPRTPTPSTSVTVEKRDGSFQTVLSIAPTEDIESNKQLFIHDSTPSPISTGSSITTGQQQEQQQHRHHHHHHHRKHKSRNNTSSTSISTRDVGLQVNIQTVKKITISSQKSEESSLATTTTPSPPILQPPRELKNVETNTEPLITTHDISTSYEPSLHLITTSSQTIDSSSSSPTTTTTTNIDRQTKAAQTSNKTLRDQSIETNNFGLFVCDLSSLLKNGSDELSSLPTKRKS